VLVFRRFALASLAATALVTLAHAQVPAPTLTPPVRPAASAQPADEVAIARQIIDLGFPEERREAMFFATVDQMTMQMRESVLANIEEQDPGAIAILDEWLAEYIADGKTILRSHIPNLMNAWALSYAAIFTKEELEDILAFVSTPSGQKFFERSAAVMAEPNFAAANQAYMNEVNANLPEAQADLTERLMQYFRNKGAEPGTSAS